MSIGIDRQVNSIGFHRFPPRRVMRKRQKEWPSESLMCTVRMQHPTHSAISAHLSYRYSIFYFFQI